MQKKSVGLILVAIGVLMMIYTGFSYVTTKKVVDLGAVEIKTQKNHPVQWSPIVGFVLIVGGIAVIITPKVKV